ncbi:MAG: apolipoprotein N-acyltransferase [Candidatus Melainabacteria bacterium]|nr:apolipoprotein N-acyltransferase [Candidatus Melainabacteria bacterium]
MPTITKEKKQSEKPAKKGAPLKVLSVKEIVICALSGAVLGLAAPGINLWYIAWFGLAPLLLLIVSSKSGFTATARGFIFGTCFNLVYLNWYLGLQPLDWLGFNWWQGWLMACAAWLIVSMHQGILIGLFALASYLIPVCESYLPRKISGVWRIPAFLLFPGLWVLILNKLGNAPSMLGVPWSMLEYTQYQQTQVIQVASIIGGIGVGFLIVLANVSVANLVATLHKKSTFKLLASDRPRTALIQLGVTALILVGAYVAGAWDSSRASVEATRRAAVLQGNINIEMQKTKKRWNPLDLFHHYQRLLTGARPGLIVYTESAMPVFFREHDDIVNAMGAQARSLQSDMVLGAMDRLSAESPYNSAFGITSDGKLLNTVYHKRYLVPFGEYPPAFIEYLPDWIRVLTNTPAGGGFAAGQDPAVLKLRGGKVAPLICFECISPELVASSTRHGGELLVNLSDLAWFHDSSIGEQMLAFSVFRAVENRRFFVFAANTGPSAIINPRGEICQRSGLGQDLLLEGSIGFISDMSIFSQWYR